MTQDVGVTSVSLGLEGFSLEAEEAILPSVVSGTFPPRCSQLLVMVVTGACQLAGQASTEALAATGRHQVRLDQFMAKTASDLAALRVSAVAQGVDGVLGVRPPVQVADLVVPWDVVPVEAVRTANGRGANEGQEYETMDSAGVLSTIRVDEADVQVPARKRSGLQNSTCPPGLSVEAVARPEAQTSDPAMRTGLVTTLVTRNRPPDFSGGHPCILPFAAGQLLVRTYDAA